MSLSATSDVERFVKFVQDISRTQRNHITQCIEQTVNFEKLWYKYFIGCIVFNTCLAYGFKKIKGPRNYFREWKNIVNPIVPIFFTSWISYFIVFTFRLHLRRIRIYNLIDDYEYDLKRVKAHHSPEGLEQLA